MAAAVSFSPETPDEKQQAEAKLSLEEQTFQAVKKNLLAKFPSDCIPEDRLTFLSHLGAGEFGRVDKYEYVDENSVKKMVALKLLNRNLLTNPKDVKNFVNEMRTLKKLNHPSIAAYLGTGTIKATVNDGLVEEHLFMAQECCEGENMQDHILKQMKMKPREQLYKWSEVVTWMTEVCSGLQYMHEHKPMIIHRDLKPANIILVDGGNGTKHAKLVDFGLHKVIHIHSEESLRGGTAMFSHSRDNSAHGGWSSLTNGPGSRDNSGHSNGSAHGKRAFDELMRLGHTTLGHNRSVHARSNFHAIEDQAFQMTGGCGSLIYMAPEVHKAEAYNQSVDVFAIALIFWEFFAFRMQITMVGAGEGGLSFQALNEYTTNVCCGLRPPLPKMWPKSLRTLLGDMWDQDLSARPSFRQVVERLADIKVLVDELEKNGNAPHFMGVLPGMRLQPPKPKKKDSLVGKLKSMFKSS